MILRRFGRVIRIEVFIRIAFYWLSAIVIFSSSLAQNAYANEGLDLVRSTVVPRIALVRFVSRGDFFEAYLDGVKRQAKALGVELIEMGARQDPLVQAEMVEQAIAMGVEGIIVQHGREDTLIEVSKKAVETGIPIVAFDVDVKNENVPQIEQSDAEIVSLLTEQMLKDNGDRFNAAYIYFPGPTPLDRRDAVWQAFKKKQPGVQELATFGTMDQPIPRFTANQARAVLTVHSDVDVIFAPYDDFALGAKSAVQEADLSEQIKIYSADITDRDIKEMREPGSPWVATAASNPYLLGEVSVRSVAMLMAGEDPGRKIVVQPRLITRGLLNSMNITSLKDLARRMPEFADQDIAKPDWMPVPER
ncbi:substrate-binding domain-containing protein [Cohaesibacter gelatinilyticus]|uniref:Monosaccharide ABC transporter substrate-binding protein, CUT2 family n=1 Tax=Cohaesibacter gelatinilyticus TaxID=372072 RepID=A0A285PBA3_9HYPH|nr:substrate-binding domain-containing protein [Cohaesibacter gelatinilyticus]SNZ19009.1 monosaccharide ABC transporter substrate-binding protein, CUT2 family [Cohaesibacter gelatinilyticus]